jgi:1,4-dihydroxy-2-naphthoyl-CoA hydrolase
MELKNTLMEALGIEVVALDKDLVEMTMPVDERTHQPLGFLHGGANVALAESAASIGACLHVDLDHFHVFGIEINANHVKSKRDGVVTAKATPIHVGKTTMVWEINIRDEEENLICISRCTVGVVPKKANPKMD